MERIRLEWETALQYAYSTLAQCDVLVNSKVPLAHREWRGQKGVGVYNGRPVGTLSVSLVSHGCWFGVWPCTDGCVGWLFVSSDNMERPLSPQQVQRWGPLEGRWQSPCCNTMSCLSTYYIHTHARACLIQLRLVCLWYGNLCLASQRERTRWLRELECSSAGFETVLLSMSVSPVAPLSLCAVMLCFTGWCDVWSKSEGVRGGNSSLCLDQPEVNIMTGI